MIFRPIEDPDARARMAQEQIGGGEGDGQTAKAERADTIETVAPVAGRVIGTIVGAYYGQPQVGGEAGAQIGGVVGKVGGMAVDRDRASWSRAADALGGGAGGIGGGAGGIGKIVPSTPMQGGQGMAANKPEDQGIFNKRMAFAAQNMGGGR